jgi:hypothetical protein
MYSMTPKLFRVFLGYDYPKYAEFHADFKSVKRKSASRKKSYLPKTFAN